MTDSEPDYTNRPMTGPHDKHEKGEMTHHEQAKNSFAMHQDNLFWSRLPLVVTIQGATLAGAYATQGDKWIALGLTGLGFLFTIMVLATMRRDDILGEAAFKESRIPRTDPPGFTGYKRVLKGKVLAYLAIGLLLVVDIVLPVVLYCRSSVEQKPTLVTIVPAANP